MLIEETTRLERGGITNYVMVKQHHTANKWASWRCCYFSLGDVKRQLDEEETLSLIMDNFCVVDGASNGVKTRKMSKYVTLPKENLSLYNLKVVMVGEVALTCCCIDSNISSFSRMASSADTWSQVALACRYVDASRNEPKMIDESMTVKATILAIFTEFAWRSL